MKYKASIVICTRNRAPQLMNCINSILKNDLKRVEVIVIDQSDNKETYNSIKKTNIKNLQYLHQSVIGLSKARNFGINKTDSPIIIFTDDDCIVSKSWIKTIIADFEKNPGVDAVFGTVLPYTKTKRRGFKSVSCINYKAKKVITRILSNKRIVFQGNTMSFRKKVFEDIGGFSEWLGAGTNAFGAEDEEVAYRLLKSGRKILLDPKVLLYHDRWVEKKEYDRIMNMYCIGFFAAFSYHAVKGEREAQKILIEDIKKNLQLKFWFVRIKEAILNRRPKLSLYLLWGFLKVIFESRYYLKGMIIGTFRMFSQF